MRITVDFDTNEIIIDTDNQKSVITDIDLKSKEPELLRVLGLEKMDATELRADINELFSSLGLDVKCAE